MRRTRRRRPRPRRSSSAAARTSSTASFGIFGLGEVLYGPFFDLAPRKEPWPAEIMNEYGKLATAAARAGWHVHQHVINNNAVTDLLDTLEQVNKTQRSTACAGRSGHVYDISPANIARAKALGMTLGVHGAAMQAGAHMPLRKIADSGIVFGLGTDATIVSHYSPFVTLGWVVSGLDVGGNRVLDETLTREEALIAHTRSNAYLFFQEKTLGSLEVGKQADLVVLDRDYMTVPAAEIRRIRPTMTMVGGRVVFEGAQRRGAKPGRFMEKMKAYADFDDYLENQSVKNQEIIRALRKFVKRVEPELREAVSGETGAGSAGMGPWRKFTLIADTCSSGSSTGRP